MLQKLRYLFHKWKKNENSVLLAIFFLPLSSKLIVIIMRKTILLLLALAGCCMASAKVVLPQLFQSGMVLQRGKPIPIWGKADPLEQVNVKWQKKSFITTADAEGRWRIDLPKTKAGGPYILEVKGGDDSPLQLMDVLVGDVWLCSGQSNIDVTIERVYPQYVDEIDHFDNPSVRLFRVRNTTNTHGVQDDILPTSWTTLTKEHAWQFSALGTFLAQRMQQKTGVPQGVIVNSWGGTPIEAWLPADSLAKDYPQLLQKTALYDNKEYVAAQQQANTLADRRWNELLDQQDPGIAGHYTALDCDDSRWQVIDQNHWGWRGTGSTWLRQHVQIDRVHAGQPARLLLGTLFDADITYVNGQQVGRTYYQYPPRRYDIPAGVLHEGDNVITIRFINKYGTAHFIPEKPYMLCFGADRQRQNPMPEDVIALSNQWLHHAGVSMPSCPSGDVSLQNLPTTLYNAVLYPLAPYALSGIVWYQGESNTGNPAPYGDYLQKLMGSWRTLWQDPALPFCIVQLANYDGRQQTGMPSPITPQTTPVNSNWARLREAQRQATMGDEHAETACIIDLGERVDIHPLRKKEAAERVALCMDRLVYGEWPALSAQPVGHDVKGGEVTVIFDQPMEDSPVSEVEVAGADKRFVNVEATMSGAYLKFHSPIAAPLYVRYAWKDCPRADMRSRKGLPAFPFEYTLR
jgi:sialate O-acetylesterase